MATFHFIPSVLFILSVVVLSALCEEVDNPPQESITNSSSEDVGSSVLQEIVGQLRSLGMNVSTEHNSTETMVSARMKMSDMFHPVMLVPQLIMWGFAPIILANLKMFVMQALMLNKMALNAAIFMTLRNIVFGPRPGGLVKYANHGYKTPNGGMGGSIPHYLRRS